MHTLLRARVVALVLVIFLVLPATHAPMALAVPIDSRTSERAGSEQSSREDGLLARIAADGDSAVVLQRVGVGSGGGDEPSPDRTHGPVQSIVLPPRSATPPTFTPAQLRQLEDGTRQSYRPVPPVPDDPRAPRLAGRPAVPETAAPSGTGEIRPRAPTDFALFRNSIVAPGGSLRSATSEPSVANAGNVVFYTANWFAAVSGDGGQTFSFVNPFAFPPPSSGQSFCCDQVIIYSPDANIFIWMLQYSTASGVNNVQRIAVATPTQVLAGLWRFFDITSASTAFGAGFFLDYPHFALSNSFFYYTTNVFPATGAGVGTVIFRFSLSELAALVQGSTPTSQQFRNTAASLTYTPVQGATTTMYFSRNDTNTTHPIFVWPESVGSGGITSSLVTHSSFPTGARACAGPDGLNWCGRNDTRLKGGWVAGGVIGFLWDASQGTGGLGTFAFPYTHVIRVNESTKALIDEPVIFNNTVAFQFPGVSVNGRGHLGVSIAFGGGSFFPSSDLLLRDDVSPNAWQALTARFGLNGPGTDRWGDFLTTRPFNGNGNAWVATGYTLQGACAGGGTPCSTVEPRFFIFGRERDNPVCPTPRPNVGRSLTVVNANRLQVNLSTTAGSFSSITTTGLTNATLEVNGAPLAQGATAPLTGTSTTVFVNRLGPGAFTARFTIADGCGGYPLFFGRGS